MSERLPMFPLGTVIFPYTAIPLRVFESRYQALLDRVLDEQRSFGSVLIERGFEVGGGDQRFEVGTRLEVVGVTDLEEGHRAIVVAGTGRIRVDRWLDDDPHPWAEVSDSPDGALLPAPGSIETACIKLERVMVLVSELGEDTSGVDLSVSEDAAVASFQLAALTPVTPIDAYRLLAVDTPAERVDEVNRMLDDQIDLLRATLADS